MREEGGGDVEERKRVLCAGSTKPEFLKVKKLQFDTKRNLNLSIFL